MNRAGRIHKDGHDGVEPVEFYLPSDKDGRFGLVGVFSNFSSHEVHLEDPWRGKLFEYPSGEHRFQAMKATTAEDHLWIATCDSPGLAKRLGHRIQLRDGWGNSYGALCWYVMLEVVLAKAAQHSEVMAILAGTGDHPIWEDSPTDDIWGIRYDNDYRGKNLLGKAWEQARAIFKEV